MTRYEVCIVTKEYRWVEVDAEDECEARDMVWDNIDFHMNYKPEDYDTELFVERALEVINDQDD